MSSVRTRRLLAPDYLGDLRARTLDEIRAMRTECQEVEVGLSYLRRLVQGRLDIVAAEQRRRAQGGEPFDTADLVEHLPEILAEHGRAGTGPGRLPTLIAPGDDPELTAELDELVGPDTLGGIDEIDDADVTRLIEQLGDLEHRVSAQRRALHERIDALQAELTRRYKTGEATVESLLG